MKKYGIAVFLSALLPGAGQFYNRNWIKGTLFLVVSSVLMEEVMRNISLSDLLAGKVQSLTEANPLFLLLTLAIAFWSMIDAYRHGKKNPAP
ncbi:MAG TPA: hypothetical protein VN944_06950 [Nitrospiria bacterium]|nr:hypothetical protein [Nitrospiria bacterium]